MTVNGNVEWQCRPGLVKPLKPPRRLLGTALFTIMQIAVNLSSAETARPRDSMSSAYARG